MSSLDLSEFFSNDDSDGHRLAEFLQKRRGGVQRPNLLYLNYETQRKSLHVQLEKLPDKIEEKLCDEDKGINEQNEKQYPTVEDQLASIHGESVVPSAPILSPSNEGLTPVLPIKPLSPPGSVRPLSPSRLLSPSRPLSPSKPLSPSRPLSPSKPLSPSRPLSPSKPLSPSIPLSPRLSVIRKSGGIVSPGDRLRRLSLKRLTTKVHGGRRTLLQEFDSTVNFDPPVCSTPLSQPIVCPSSPTTSASPGNTENIVPNSENSCCGNSDTLIKTLQRQDEELKNYMGIFETTLKNLQQQDNDRVKNNTKDTASLSKSQHLEESAKVLLKRTYTLEKGQSPGQVILTPDKSVAESQNFPSRMLRSCRQHSPPITQQPYNKVIKTPIRSSNRSMISISTKSPISRCTSPQRLNQSLRQMEESPTHSLSRSAIMVNKSRSTTPLHCSLPNDVVPNTPPRNISFILPSQEVTNVEIPETQEVPLAADMNCIMIQSNNTSMPVVIIPVNQNYNQPKMEYPIKNNALITAKPKSLEKCSEPPSPTKIDECQSKPEDHLTLADILTDDDDDTPKAASRCNNNSQAPLNLAPSATNVRTKRLRKRSLSRRRLEMDRSQLLSTETEAEPPAAHSNIPAQRRRTVRRKNIPLNRAPGTPLNGERFALELYRMSNYEIIDLRKRNSMGRVFAISGRKSSRLQEVANKKQLQLDDEIEMELLRRNLEESTNNKSIRQADSPTNGPNNTKRLSPEDLIPVPQEFRDNSTQEDEMKQLESSLLDEKSTDRISFKNKRSSLRNPSKRKVKSVPRELQQYLEVSKILKTKRKTRQPKMDQSKRSLYTQGYSDTEEYRADSSADKLEINQKTNKNTTKLSLNKSITVDMETSIEQSMPQLPSPPHSETDQMPALRVVSPPPPLTISIRESETQKDVQANDDEPLPPLQPPPPPEFDTDSGVSSTPCGRQHSLLQQKPAKTLANGENDDDIFKKPLTPPPPKKKTRSRKKTNKIDNVLLNDMHTAEDTSADSSLRRSKRQVTVPIPIFQMLYQQSFNRRLQNMEKNHARQKQRLKEMSKATLGDNSTISSIKSVDSSQPLKKSSQKRQQKKLAAVPEDEPLIESQQNDMDNIKNKKKAKTLKTSKVVRKKSKNDHHIESYLECSRINLTTPPPVDHFNNVFDHLRDTSTAVEHDYGEASQPLQQKQQKQQQQINDIFKGKKLRVRIKRLTSSRTGEESKGNSKSTRSANAVSSSSSAASVSSVGSNQSNFELISWLKNITEAESMQQNDEIFKEMRISSASNLSFSTIQGVEYAFYDTDEKASLGYLRFKPGQIKPKKKAKRYHLHFVTLVGQFRITANDKESRVGPGDMVAIEKSVYYDIENVTDDTGILMVVKK